MAVNTGEFTGRSPKDRFIVKDDITKDKIWWGNINIPFESDSFDALYDKVIAYLDTKELYVRDSYACADADYRLNIRVINEYPWSNMFAYNMFLRPSDEELEDFDPEWTVVNAPGFMADPEAAQLCHPQFWQEDRPYRRYGLYGRDQERDILRPQLYIAGIQKYPAHALLGQCW